MHNTKCFLTPATVYIDLCTPSALHSVDRLSLLTLTLTDTFRIQLPRHPGIFIAQCSVQLAILLLPELLMLSIDLLYQQSPVVRPAPPACMVRHVRSAGSNASLLMILLPGIRVWGASFIVVLRSLLLGVLCGSFLQLHSGLLARGSLTCQCVNRGVDFLLWNDIC